MSWLLENWSVIGLAALSVIGGLWAAAKAIAPLTDSKLDDKLAGILGKVHGVLTKLLGLK